MRKITVLLLAMMASSAYAAPRDMWDEASYNMTFFDQLGNGSHQIQIAVGASVWCANPKGELTPTTPFDTTIKTYSEFSYVKELAISISPINNRQYLIHMTLDNYQLTNKAATIYCRVVPDKKSVVAINCTQVG